LLNIKTNRPKLVSMCRYKLATYWQNFTEIYLTQVKILQKVLGGGYFILTHTVLKRATGTGNRSDYHTVSSHLKTSMDRNARHITADS